jgi:hypothetical protein
MKRKLSSKMIASCIVAAALLWPHTTVVLAAMTDGCGKKPASVVDTAAPSCIRQEAKLVDGNGVEQPANIFCTAATPTDRCYDSPNPAMTITYREYQGVVQHWDGPPPYDTCVFTTPSLTDANRTEKLKLHGVCQVGA